MHMVARIIRKFFFLAIPASLPFLISCSFSRSTTTLSTPAIITENAPFELEQVSSNPSIYLIKDSALGEKRVFVSIFKECRVKEGRDLTASTRSLFVGLEKLDITGQSAFQYQDSTILESEASGTVDGRPVSLLVYSERTKDCVRDLLVWTLKQDEEDGGRWKEILRDRDRIVDLLRKQ